MFGRGIAAGGGRVRSRVVGLTVAAAFAVPGAVVLMPSSAGAAGSDPLGPTVTQVETFVSGAETNTQTTLDNVSFTVENLVFGPFGVLSDVSCLVGDVVSGPTPGPCVDGG